uniref:Microtubule associated protein 1 light chain 3 gamma n=1 Tax=Equus asinus TaxID=9793 RepID=A0A9L0KIM3_EQUAS
VAFLLLKGAARPSQHVPPDPGENLWALTLNVLDESNQTRGSCWNPGKVPKQDPGSKIPRAPVTFLGAESLDRRWGSAHHGAVPACAGQDPVPGPGPQGLTVTQCLGIIRSPMVLRATEAFHLLVNHRSVASVSVTVAEIYRDCKDEDGFVYMTCASQEVFGGLGSAATSWGQTLPSSPVCVDTVLGWLHQSRQPPPVCGGWSRQGRLQ